MGSVLHWMKIRLFCYATEDEEKLGDLMEMISGTDDIDAEVSDGHHGNSMLIFSADLKNNAECASVFKRFGKDAVAAMVDRIEEMIDDDCTFYLRMDKQAALSGVYEIAHHGDVISVTCKIVSHPAKKETAVANMRTFLENILNSM